MTEWEKTSVSFGGEEGVWIRCAIKQLMEKYCEKNKNLYLVFMDLEKAYYRVGIRAIWKMYAGDGVLGRAVEVL